MTKTTGSPEPLEGRCGAKLRGTDPARYCLLKPSAGATKCRKHGAKSPQAERKAAERVAERKFAQRMATMGILDEYPNTDPAMALMLTVAKTQSEVEWWEGIVRDLDTDDVIWGKVSHDEGIGPMGAVDMTTSKAELNVAVRSLIDARGRLVKWSAEALRAGINERQMQLAEGQAAQMIGAVQRALGSADIPADVLERIHAALAREFRALDAKTDKA